ncbi:calmodulin-binding protein 60 B-like [Rhodamnia argentea]|uniref:Calmodulin-binding protein 60 B-like n=1 Tax=Rhodamnia argentea TaxID=178133 RepID=A0A8B8QIT3_9MYRT|nr:calmodulin-binding protein 60 B-like [Rhodamnia argentea]
MVFKRPFPEEGEEGFGASKRRLIPQTARDVIGRFSESEILHRIEPFLRIVVREELDHVFSRLQDPLQRTSINPAGDSVGGGGLQLRFVNQLMPKVFTGCKIKAEDGSPIKIELFDTRTNCIVQNGSLSSARIEVLVLDGDFGSDNREDWSETEFRANIVREREGRRPLVVGERSITLQGGVGYLTNIMFTDNSSWIRSRNFRLGAQIERKISADVRIREGRSGKFVVKDHRGELYKKHYPPNLKDKVWRLEKISKDGIFQSRLASVGIHTVKDFLRKLETDPIRLRNILGNLSNKTWKAIVEHAMTCNVDDNEAYIYFDASQSAGLLFNSTYKVISATFDGQNYHPLENLTFHQKHLVSNLKQQAYLNVNELIQTRWPSIAPPRALNGLPASGSIIDSCSSEPHIDFPSLCQGIEDFEDPVGPLPGFNHLASSTSYNSEAVQSRQYEVSISQDYHPELAFNPIPTSSSFVMGNAWAGLYHGENNSQYNPQRTLDVNSHLAANMNVSQIEASYSFPSSSSSAWTPGNGLFIGSLGEAEVGIFSSFPDIGLHIRKSARPKAGWCKIRAAVKWGSVRRDAAARRMARLLYM